MSPTCRLDISSRAGRTVGGLGCHFWFGPLAVSTSPAAPEALNTNSTKAPPVWQKMQRTRHESNNPQDRLQASSGFFLDCFRDTLARIPGHLDHAALALWRVRVVSARLRVCRSRCRSSANRAFIARRVRTRYTDCCIFRYRRFRASTAFDVAPNSFSSRNTTALLHPDQHGHPQPPDRRLDPR